MTRNQIAALLLASLLLSGCDDAALRTWNKLFGEKGKSTHVSPPPSAAPARASTRAPATASTPLPPSTTAPLAATAEAKQPAVSAPQATQAFEFAPANAGATRFGDTCSFPGLQLPANTRVYAAGAYSGRTLDYQIDQSGHSATRIDVAVNSPSAPVVLLLGAYEPTVWSVGWSRGSKILAVLVSGYHRQAITGLNADVPVLISSYDNKGPCGYFYVRDENSSSLNPMAKRVFSRPIDRVYSAADGQVLIGDDLTNSAGLVTAKGSSIDAFRDRNAPLAGEAGINEALRKGVLREATTVDLQAWTDALAAAQARPPVTGHSLPGAPQLIPNAYVVRRAFEFPAGLYGANAITVIVPKGIPSPTGNGGHSQVYNYNTLTCIGLACPR